LLQHLEAENSYLLQEVQTWICIVNIMFFLTFLFVFFCWLLLFQYILWLVILRNGGHIIGY